MSETSPSLISEETPIAIHFNPIGETEAVHGLSPTKFQEKEMKHGAILGYMLLFADACEVTAAILTGFGWDDYLMIGATTLAFIASRMVLKGEKPSNFFKIAQDRIIFSRTTDGTHWAETLMKLKLMKPKILSVQANEMARMEIQLDEAHIFLKDGKKKIMDLTHLKCKHALQNLLLEFCEKHSIPVQISSLALRDRKSA